MTTGSPFTAYGWILCTWILLIPFQYGYHISVLNQIQAVLTCKQAKVSTGFLNLPTCIQMNDFSFSLVTSLFTLGGLLGSLTGSNIIERYGLKGGARLSAFLVAFGTAIMSISSTIWALSFGRFVIGISSGLGLCIGPIYIAEIAPPKISGTVGVSTQLAIVVGIFLTQLIGLNFATPSSWRLVFFLSFALGVVQWVVSGFMVDPPKRLSSKEEVIKVEMRIWGVSPSSIEESSSPASSTPSLETNPLLAGAELDDNATIAVVENQPISLLKVLLRPPRDVRRPMLVVCCAMVGQQVSGINAVLYYSNEILSKSLPELGPYVSLAITIVNVVMTFPPIILVERLGRKQLLTISTVGALASLIIVGFAMDSNWIAIASAGIVTFVMSFAVGLGPIPFIMIPEVSPFYAVSALASLALSLNWIVNFIVGLLFLPLRNMLSGGDARKEGRVFLVFAVILFVVMSVVRVAYRG